MKKTYWYDRKPRATDNIDEAILKIEQKIKHANSKSKDFQNKKSAKMSEMTANIHEKMPIKKKLIKSTSERAN